MITPLLLAAATALAAPLPSLDYVLHEMENREAQITDLRFDFQQEINIRLTGEKQEITGSAVFKKPDKFSVRHTLPEEEYMVSDGKWLWQYVPRYNQVAVERLNPSADQAQFPSGLFDFRSPIRSSAKNYDLRVLGWDGEAIILEMSPKRHGGHRVRLWVSPSTWMPDRTELSNDQLTILTRVIALRSNQEVGDEEFHFKIPRGAQVLKSVLSP